MDQDAETMDRIARQAADGRCVLFLGAGASAASATKSGQAAPATGRQLAAMVAGRFALPGLAEAELANVCTVVDDRYGRRQLADYLYEVLGGLQPSAGLLALPRIRWQAIYTVNIDMLVEDAYRLSDVAKKQALHVVLTDDQEVGATSQDRLRLYKLHGCVSQGARQHAPLVLTHKDYRDSERRNRVMLQRLNDHLQSHTPVFVGFGMSDYDIMRLVEAVSDAMGRANLPRGYSVDPYLAPEYEGVLEGRKITPVRVPADDFLRQVADAVAKLANEKPDALAVSVTGAPGGLDDALKAVSPLHRDAILGSFRPLCDGDFSEAANTAEFLRGAPPNWGIFREHHHVDRHGTNEVIEALLEWYVDESQLPACIVVTGEAGAGKTTLMMRAVYDIVRAVGAEQTANALLPYDVSRFDGDAFEALSGQLGTHLLVVVDDITPCATDIADFMRTARAARLKVMVLGGARQNEWDDATSDLPIANCQVMPPLGPLCMQEAEQLARILEDTGNLGVLSSLSFHDRVGRIMEKHGRQLLVALREATEGKPFEEIVASEARAIPHDVARRVYLRVCAAHAFSCPLRIGVAKAVAEVPFAQFGDDVYEPTKGIMFAAQSPRDAVYVQDALVTRHPKVAEMVMWGSFTTDAERQAVYLDIIRHLDPGRPEDRRLLRELSNSRLMDDFVGELELRVEVFMRLIDLQPRDPYVRQHLARLYLRHERADLAMQAITEGIDLVGDDPVLLDTKARVLTAHGRAARGPQLAAAYLRQAEDLFSQLQRRNPRSSYAYHGLADVRRAEADIAPSGPLRVRKIGEAVDTLEEGIRRAEGTAKLLVALSEAHTALGSPAEARKALEAALKESPGDPRGTYLLGIVEMDDGHYERAAEMFARRLRADPKHPRTAYLYAGCLASLGRPTEETSAAYRLAHELGYEPQHQVLYELGRYLFLEGDYEGMREAFRQVKSMGTLDADVHKRRDQARDDNGRPRECRGRIGRLSGTACWIELEPSGCPIYSNRKELPPGSGVGDRVSFLVYFNLLGPVAWRIRAA